MVSREYYLDYIDWYREIRFLPIRYKDIKFEFAEEITKMVSIWAYLLYKRNRSNHMQNVRSLDPANLALFKQNYYDEQIQFCTNIQQEIFGLSWPHEVDESAVVDPSDIFYMKYNFYKDVDDIIRRSIGCIGKLLIEHGFTSKSDNQWKWVSKRNTYEYALGVPRGLKSYKFKRLVKQYDSILNEYVELLRRFRYAKDALLQAQARELWQSA